jgi:hypothetical protein
MITKRKGSALSVEDMIRILGKVKNTSQKTSPQLTKELTNGGEMREGKVDVPGSI